MATVTAAQVKALRELTDQPMMDCKKALQKADGDQERAIELLREASGAKLDKRKDNLTNEGQVFIAVADDGSAASMVEIQCESAPVATGEDLSNLGQAMAAYVLAHPEADSVDSLMASTPDGGAQTFQAQFDEMVSKIREKIVVNRVAHETGHVGTYVHHNKKNAVVFVAEGDGKNPEILRDVAMHIAALSPTVVRPEELDDAAVSAERDRLSEEARSTGKPENIIEKIVSGRMNSFYVEQGVLLNQPFAKDDSKTVAQALKEAGYEASRFHRWVIGN